MDRLRALRPPVRTSGLLLALVVFLVLPLASASCSVPKTLDEQAGTIEVSASGADLVSRSWALAGEGSFAPGPGSTFEDAELSLERRPPDLATTLAGVSVVVLLLAGAALAWRGRSVLVRGLALASAVGIAVTAALTRDELHGVATLTLAATAGFFSRQGRPTPEAEQFLAWGAGTWLPLLLLAALLGLEGVWWRQDRVAAPSAGSRPSPSGLDGGS